jgi:hypothetical protein
MPKDSPETSNSHLRSSEFRNFVNSPFLINTTAVQTAVVGLMFCTAIYATYLIHSFLIPFIIMYFIFGRYRPYYYILAIFHLLVWFYCSTATFR